MSLVDVKLNLSRADLPADVEKYLREANSRVEKYVASSPIRVSGFVPSDAVTVYWALAAIAEAKLSPSHAFCEWGSGFGVAASLATMLDFHACGIEIEQPLVEAARELAADFGLPVEFVHGSFIPADGQMIAEQAYAEGSGEFSWLVTDADDAYDELGLDPDDFDIVFAYPWPGEEHVIDRLFDRCAADGALLLTYNQFDSVRVQRKKAKRRRMA